ncbi:unnamed protein product [Brugia pahangi]|uniref:Nuclear pore complex protein Nup85 n=1 Tax=Brugia pahangi TaxID=6280 RepID=A0A0N4THX6_BRUPA|nr:unnamed protein product [Brugia pahangi]
MREMFDFICYTAGGRGNVLSYSLQYRSIIRSTLSTIPVSEYEIKESLTTAELIWSLVEAIFIKTHDSSIVVDLMSWARLCLAHTPYVDEISKVLRGSKIKRLNKQHFWQQVRLRYLPQASSLYLPGFLSELILFIEE